MNQPNIVIIYEIVEDDNKIFIALEYVDVNSLRTKIDTCNSDFDEVLAIMKQICEGLFEEHKANIIHRDHFSR